MANRSLDPDQKVAAMRECLTLREVSRVMAQYGFSERSAWNWLAPIREGLPGVLERERPGPKPLREAAPPF